MNFNLIYRVPKLYSKQSCKKLINFFDNNVSKATKGRYGDKKLDNLEITIDIIRSQDWFNLGEALMKGINNYKKQCVYLDTNISPWSYCSSAQLCRYEPNNYYSKVHCENDGDKDSLKRVFAWMFFLNDIKKGGGTEFILQKYVAKPKAGDFYIWPAYWTHFHRGVKAPKERKYIVTGWCEYV